MRELLGELLVLAGCEEDWGSGDSFNIDFGRRKAPSRDNIFSQLKVQ